MGFAALLEAFRLGRVRLEQEENFGPLWVERMFGNQEEGLVSSTLPKSYGQGNLPPTGPWS